MMKKLFSILTFVFCAVTAFSQLPTVVEVGQDSFRIKRGEFVLRNQTKDVIGVLVNIGGGVTKFKEFRVTNDSTLIFDGDTLIFNNASITGGNDTVVNVGEGAAIYKGKDGREFQMKTLVSDSSIVFTSFDDSLRLQVDPGVFTTVTRLLDSLAAIRNDQVRTWQNTLDVPTGNILTHHNHVNWTTSNAYDFTMRGAQYMEFESGDSTYAGNSGEIDIGTGNVAMYAQNHPHKWANVILSNGSFFNLMESDTISSGENIPAFGVGKNSMTEAWRIERNSNTGVSAPLTGFGSYIGFSGSTDEQDALGAVPAMRLGWKWTSLAGINSTAQFELHLANSGTIERAMAITGQKQLILDGYGAGTFTGVISKWLAVDAFGNVIEVDSLPSATNGDSVYTVNSGLSASTPTNFQLGAINNSASPLLHHTWINSDVYTLTVRGTSPTWPFQVENTSTGYAGRFSAISKPAIQAVINPATTNTIAPALDMLRASSGTIANGIGVGTDYYAQTTAGGTSYMGTTGMAWSDINFPSRTSRYDVLTLNSGTTSRKLSVAGNGRLTLDKYGVNTFAGTPTFTLGVDALGNVVEYTPATGTGTGLTSISANNGLFANTASNIQLGTNPLLYNTTVPTSTFSMSWTGAFSGNLFNVTNTNTTGSAINAQAGASAIGVNSQAGLYGVYATATASNSVGVRGESLGANGNGVVGYATATTGNPLQGYSFTTDQSNVLTTLNLTRSVNAAIGLNNIGQKISFVTQTSSVGQMSNEIVSRWRNATLLSRISLLEINGVNNALTSRLFALDGTGQLTLDKYGIGTFTGTATKLLATTATGGVIEVDPGDIGEVGGTVTADRGLHTSSSTNVRWGGLLDSIVDIDQNGQGIVFHDGLFTHAWGDYDPGVEDFSVLTSGENNFTVNLKGSGTYNTASMSLTKVGDIGMNIFANSDDNPGGNSLDVLADYIWLYSANGNIHLEGIPEATEAYNLQYNLSTKRVSYSSGLPSGAVTNFGGAHEVGVVSGGTVKLKTLIAGAGVDIDETDSTITISSSAVGSETNTLAFNLTTTGNRTIAADNIVQYVLVKPASTLAAFKIGTVSDDDFYLTATPVTGGAWIAFNLGEYLDASTALYFSGITSSTDIKIIYKPLHE